MLVVSASYLSSNPLFHRFIWIASNNLPYTFLRMNFIINRRKIGWEKNEEKLIKPIEVLVNWHFIAYNKLFISYYILEYSQISHCFLVYAFTVTDTSKILCCEPHVICLGKKCELQYLYPSCITYPFLLIKELSMSVFLFPTNFYMTKFASITMIFLNSIGGCGTIVTL